MKSFYHSLKIVLLSLFLLLTMTGIKAEEATCSEALLAAPILVDDVFSTEEGVPVSGNLLANDMEPDGENMNMLVFPLPPPLNGNVFMTAAGTFNYSPNPGFTGVDSFGYRVCDENGECTVATVTIYVWPSGCTPSVDTYSESSCDSCTLVCLDIAMLDLENNYALTQNGGQYLGELTGCNFEAVNAYSYFGLPGQGNFGPYDLTSWTVDGNLYTGTFNNPEELVDLLNQYDPAGEWFLSAPQSLVFGGSNTSVYSTITVFDQLTSTTVDLLFNIQTIAKGTIVCLEAGSHNLAFNPLDGSCPETVANVTVSCDASPPLAVDDSYSTTAGVNATGNVLNNDIDPDGGTLVVSTTLVSLPSNGTIIQNPNGTFNYIPNANFVGTDTYEYEVCNDNFCSQATVTITVESGNNSPIAVDDSYTMNEGEVFMQNVMINDNEPDGDPMVAALVVGPNNGGIMLNANGGFTYSPAPGFIGEDEFTYELCDNQGLCDEAIVTLVVLEVNEPPVAVNDEYDILMGQTLDGAVLANDSDPEGDAMAVTTTTVSGPQMGIVTLNTDGTFNYLSPPNFTGIDQFVYEVCDIEGNCSEATVIITINAANDAPIAEDDAYTVEQDALLQGNVGMNDTDDNQTTWTFTLLSQAANGAITLNSDGTFNYMPLSGFEGEDQFTYEVCDAEGVCDQATVTVTVESNCDIIPETFESESCDPCVYICLDISFDNINDYEITVDGSPYTGEILACNPSTEIAYTYFGLLGQGEEGPYELLSWTIDGVTYSGTFNDPQGLADLMNSIDPDGSWQVIPESFVVAGGVEGQDYSIMQVQNLAAQFSFSEIGFNGGFLTTGSAICVEQGSHVVSATLVGEVCPILEVDANINCGMNEAPIAVDDDFTTSMNVFVSSTLISNDTDPNGDVLIINQTVIEGALNGTVSIGSSGAFVYLPNTGFVGIDSFTYEVCDAAGLCDEAVVTITVLPPANTPPLAVDDAYTTNVDIPVMDNVLINDTDPEGDVLTANTILVTPPSNGTVVLNADGTFTYTPNAGYVGVDMFTYETCDSSGACDEALVTITVLPLGNTPPLANDDNYTTDEDVSVTGNVLMNDTDPDGDVLAGNVILVNPPTNGIVVLNTDGTFTYTPNLGYTGEDVFAYEVCDPDGACNQALVTITILPLDDNSPTAIDDSYTTEAGVPVMDNVLINDTDPNDAFVIVSANLINAASNGTVILNADGTFTYTPNPGYTGMDMFTYEVCDPDGLCSEAVVTITVVPPGNMPPTAIDDNYTTNVDIPVMDNVLLNDTDPEGDVLEANTTLVNPPSNGAVVLNADGTFNYTPNLGYTGVDMFTYEVCDSNGSCSEALVTITVLPASCISAEVDDITIINAACGLDNGQIIVAITGNLVDYTFSWSTTEGTVSTEGNDLSGIPAGTYEVTITNADDPDCFIIQNGIVVGNDDNLAVDADIIIQPYCGYENGEVSIVVLNGSGNYTYEWTDGSTEMTRAELPEGVYGITVTDSDTGCSAITSVTLTDNGGDCNEEISIYMLQGESLDTCLTDIYDLPGTLNNAVVCYDNAMTVLATVNQDDACINLIANESFVGVDTLCMYHCNDAGYCDTTMVIVNVMTPCEEGFLDESELLLEADDCEGTAQYCLSIPFGEFQNYEVLDNGVPVSALAGCDLDIIVSYAYISLIGQGELGPYFLDSWTVDGETFSGEFETMEDLVDSMNVWNPEGEWTLNTTTNLIQGISGNDSYSPMVITHIQTNTSYDLGFNFGQYSNSTFVELTVGSHEIIATELTTGCVDTVQVEVYCLLENVIYDTLMLNESNAACFNVPTNLPGNIESASLVNDCTDASGTSISFDMPTTDGTEICINYTGIAIGTDTACVTICDDLGICETTTIIVTVPSDELEQILDTLYVGDVEVLCPEDFGFEGMLDTAYNSCPNIGENIATFEVDPASGCVVYTGLGAGENIACLTFCDDLGNCNNTYLSVLVIDTTTAILPIAVDDIDSTLQGLPVIIDIVENDTLNGILQTIVISGNPENGTAMVVGDSVVLYTPAEGFCGQDSFIYMICNETSCDTATVIIDVECTEFEIFTAVSPNGDGVNDYFVIRGIEQYNDVSVSIFNRWGNKVYEMDNERYSNVMNGNGKNPWDGTWDGKDLPDGTYFYFIDLKDGTGVKTGYVQLRR